MKYLCCAMLVSTLGGCASSVVVVRIPAEQVPRSAQGQQRAEVKVNDLRAPGIAASTREAAFGVPMGTITFDPPERQLVKDAIERALAARQQTQAPSPAETVVCDILEFGVNTVTTPLYWDVVGVIRLNLKRNGREQTLAGTHTERTYLWPGEDVIRRVVQESLRQATQAL